MSCLLEFSLLDPMKAWHFLLTSYDLALLTELELGGV